MAGSTRRWTTALAVALHREVGNVGGEAETLRNLAVVHSDTGDLDRAGDRADAALTLAHDAVTAGTRPTR